MCPGWFASGAPGSCGHILHFYTYTQTSRITYTVHPPPHTAQSRHSAARNTWRMPAPLRVKHVKGSAVASKGTRAKNQQHKRQAQLQAHTGRTRRWRRVSGRVARRCGCAGACATAHDSWLCLRAARLSPPLPPPLPSLYRRSVFPLPRLPEKRCLGILQGMRLSLSLARPWGG